MNAAETIQAAIDKLTRLREAALFGPLKVDTNYPFSSDVVGIFAPYAKVYAIKAESSADGGWDDDDEPIDDDDAPHRPTLELLVTLHATIKAQLAILEAALTFVVESGGGFESEPLDLARAILGEDVSA